MAAGAAVLLFFTMFLPWYQLNAVVNDRAGGRLVGKNMSAFGVFSFVEAAVLLVALAVLVLLFARAEGRSFHLPGGDGTIVTIAGGWTALLLIWRLFDKPDINGSAAGNVGIQWGIFFALGAAGLLTYAGVRMRAAHRPEPEGPAEVSPDERAARRRRRPAPGTEETRVLPDDEPPRRRPAQDTDETDVLPRRRASQHTDETRVLPDQPPAWDDARAPSPPPPPPAASRRRRPELSTDRLADEDPPTRRLPDPPAGIDRDPDRPAPQTERLWDDR
jgi:hypothetical protein